MTPDVQTFTKAVLKGKYEFRTMESERTNLTDNSVVKEWFDDEDQQLDKGYGRIEQMFIHEAYRGGPKLHFVKARWLENLPGAGPTSLPQVKENPNHNFNINSCFTLLEGIVPYNIALLPVDLQDPACDVFSVIDPEGRLGSCLT